MDYVYIRAYGRMMGSSANYVADQVAEARKDKAPANATHKRSGYEQDGQWSTLDDIEDNPTGRRTREQVEQIAEKMRGSE